MFLNRKGTPTIGVQYHFTILLSGGMNGKTMSISVSLYTMELLPIAEA